MVVSIYTTGHTVSSGFYVLHTTGHQWWCLYTLQDIQSVVVSMSYTLQGISGGVYSLHQSVTPNSVVIPVEVVLLH